ncbi:MAG: S24/S26 family peptidase [Myxococcales bacterium]|nr:MAG: S24/S26 family peptidase [Myxococcales bacterium]
MRNLPDHSGANSARFWSVVEGAVKEVSAFRFEVEGASMLPVLWPKDHVTVRVCSWPHVKPGDIVFGRSKRGATLHRVLCVQGIRNAQTKAFDFSFVTQGDAADQTECMPVEQCVGVVEKAYRNGKAISLNSRNGFKRIALLGLYQNNRLMRAITARVGLA